jgi:nucleoside-diphosphate-sugar epimerase/predicted dehydrogenase
MTFSQPGQPGAVAVFDDVPTTDSTHAEGQTTVASVKIPRGRGNLKRKVALLGTGYIAEWHAKAIATIRDVELVAVCDQLLPRAQAFGRKFEVPRVYGTLEALLAAEQLDAIHVLLPPEFHFQAANTILNAGVNVFVEKPMCLSAQDAKTLTRVAEARHLKLGVGQNFLFPECYERLRRDFHGGILGLIDHLTITWHRELPQLTSGPFDIWMLREPANIMLEVGSHSVAQVLDLLGTPEEIDAKASNPVELPSGQKFYRRWQVNALKGRTAVELRFSFVPGFSEYTIQARGSLASATVDFDRNTYMLRRHRPLSEDFDRYAIIADGARSVRRQARRTLLNYVMSKLHLRSNGTPYGESIAKALKSFYSTSGVKLDERIAAQRGVEVTRICQEIGRAAAPAHAQTIVRSIPNEAAKLSPPRILVLGATGFIGRELTRRLIDAGNRVRVLVRNPGKLALDLRTPRLESVQGDLNDDAALRSAMAGIDCVYHLARADAKSWSDYERYDIGVTREVAEAALAAGVKRLIYTGTIDSYYAGARAGTITEDTPLDPRIKRRNLYALAKAASEQHLLKMHRERGLPVVIVRPGIVIGRGGSPMHWGIGMWWYGSVCQIWGDGRNPLPLVLVEDVAKGLIAASEVPGIEGESFNLVDDPSISAQEYLDEVDRSGGVRIQRYATPIVKFYLNDMFKWAVKVMVRHPERRLPSYRDWESRQQRAMFDCGRAKARLGWRPTSDRAELIRSGIHAPMKDSLS